MAVRSGVAMGMIAEPVLQEHIERGDLEVILADRAVSTAGLFLYYPSRKQVMPKLRAFIDYARDYLPDDLVVSAAGRSRRPGAETIPFVAPRKFALARRREIGQPVVN